VIHGIAASEGTVVQGGPVKEMKTEGVGFDGSRFRRKLEPGYIPGKSWWRSPGKQSCTLLNVVCRRW